MIRQLHRMGVRSSMMYTAGIASIGLTAASWFLSKNYESAGMDRADRWGLFVGEWAPTFFAMGVALRMEEMQAEKGRVTEEWEDPNMERGIRMPSRAGV
ncbi:hypothetical protein Psi02_42980 [Planotetraspora silvatica]|uniref:Uncharacterized protein n=1 Tax=Planotetraspora silvatica TaxID=234614 RepID=A0A8J3UL69_9ACTN|nr:hypothetical protein [Planotetraspora silvatica]GII47874.1 hypothetical protein Psi02_42980 [Planotetraspora silvatica]